MKQRNKKLMLIMLPLLIVAGVVWTAIQLQRGLASAYYEWGVTCIIASYAEDHEGLPPAGWDDLTGYEYHSKYLPDPRTMDAAAQNISVDFASLMAFKNKDISTLPDDVIKPIRGIELHWISPKSILEGYFRDGVVPEGSLNGERAKLLRASYEVGD